MSNSEAKTNLNQNENYTLRQIQSSFQPPIFDTPPDSLSSSNETKITSDEPISVVNDTENQTTTSLIYDLKKYKHDYFISELSCNFDREHAKFGSPTGICTFDDDRLLVANYDRDTILLLDINGIVYEIYRNILAPKDLLYYSSNPCQAVVATKKEVVILDLNTKQIVARSKLRGFYPWNIQYLEKRNAFAACDPSGERMIFFDKNLSDIGFWSFNEQNPDPSKTYQKVYPYAAYFCPDDTLFVLKHRENNCDLTEYDVGTGEQIKASTSLPLSLLSYSIYVDSARKCLLADKVNHSLISIDKDSIVEEYKAKSIREPYSMAFLSTGTLCVTTWNKTFGTNGGIAIISENDLTTNQ